VDIVFIAVKVYPAPVKILLGMNFIEKVNLEIDGKNNLFEIRDP
jgi:hypothetical protein